ncbi:MAG: acetyl-CoA acyltransferase, partial [Pyrinomonadaceae bacterium]|nr:acetyl-CoA acyltransferase [Pyrinomonadaceae bacterium]
MRDAVIVSAVRTAVGKAPKGTLRDTRPDEMGAAVIEEALRRAAGVELNEVEDVIMGCAMPEAEQGMNVARAAAIRAGLPVETSAMTINRFCSSGLQSIAIAADRIRTGAADVIVAGGLETMSLIPMGGHTIRPNPYLVEHYPDFYLNMGLATENVARKYEVSREDQDEFSYQSHRRAAEAQDAGKFDDEIVPLKVVFEELDERGRKQRREMTFERDEGVRRDTSAEGLAKLRPAFHAQGTITAGNASQMSDGAAAAVVMSDERARALGLQPLARFVAYA